MTDGANSDSRDIFEVGSTTLGKEIRPSTRLHTIIHVADGWEVGLAEPRVRSGFDAARDRTGSKTAARTWVKPSFYTCGLGSSPVPQKPEFFYPGF
ncbi:hypothetical protein WN944_023760 [Citrus x changshan-huyou]|uniref:Uncharacterized protein n=1 Tax=Citrus x changshan-huyou TaxID=2935761 RepID=A0AAP0LM73_9ROSI